MMVIEGLTLIFVGAFIEPYVEPLFIAKYLQLIGIGILVSVAFLTYIYFKAKKMI